jgi:hypothetical protein
MVHIKNPALSWFFYAYRKSIMQCTKKRAH